MFHLSPHRLRAWDSIGIVLGWPERKGSEVAFGAGLALGAWALVLLCCYALGLRSQHTLAVCTYSPGLALNCRLFFMWAKL